MDLESNLQGICDRFQNEMTAIFDYINFIQDSMILSELCKKDSFIQNSIFSSYSSIEEVQTKIEDIKSEIKKNVTLLEGEVNKLEIKDIPEWYYSIDGRSDEGELIEYIVNVADEELSKEAIMVNVQNQLEALCITKGELIVGDFYIKLYEDNTKLLELIDITLNAINNSKIYELERQINILNHYTKLLKIIDTKEHLNIYRQSFIQLISAFDTAVFDCFKLKFENNFFDMLKMFENGNIKYHEIAEYKTFENLKQEVTEKKLRNCYLKDLLIIARNINKDIFLISGQDSYISFREKINCRNCHIHNNGFVDKAYLGLEDSTNVTFNVYQYGLGSYLEIDINYLKDTAISCMGFLINFKNIVS